MKYDHVTLQFVIWLLIPIAIELLVIRLLHRNVSIFSQFLTAEISCHTERFANADLAFKFFYAGSDGNISEW